MEQPLYRAVRHVEGVETTSTLRSEKRDLTPQTYVIAGYETSWGCEGGKDNECKNDRVVRIFVLPLRSLVNKQQLLHPETVVAMVTTSGIVAMTQQRGLPLGRTYYCAHRSEVSVWAPGGNLPCQLKDMVLDFSEMSHCTWSDPIPFHVE